MNEFSGEMKSLLNPCPPPLPPLQLPSVSSLTLPDPHHSTFPPRFCPAPLSAVPPPSLPPSSSASNSFNHPQLLQQRLHLYYRLRVGWRPNALTAA
eukprot:600467-Hanusia_phi.AAC.1